MVKGWADQSSDDEEDMRERHAMLDKDMAALQQQPHHPPPKEDAHQDQHHVEPRERVYEFPTQPPFTAYVGNVAYTVEDPTELSEALTRMAKETLNLDINVKDTRIVINRRETPPKHRGFAYVTVETLDKLKGLMELNDKDLQLANRFINFNIAKQSNDGRDNNRRRDGGGRGDRDNRRTYDSNDGGGKWDRGQGQSAGRGDGGGVRNDGVDGSKFRGGRYNASPREDAAPETEQAPSGPRPTLKLQPRTKPVDEGRVGGSQTSLFGGAKPRDESSWRKEHADEGGRGRGGRGEGRGARGEGRGGRGEGRGGRGEGRGARGEGRGGRGRDSEDRKTASAEKPKREPRVPQPKVEPKPVQPEPEKKKEVTNKFAALGFDSDSD